MAKNIYFGKATMISHAEKLFPITFCRPTDSCWRLCMYMRKNYYQKITRHHKHKRAGMPVVATTAAVVAVLIKLRIYRKASRVRESQLTSTIRL